MKKGGDIYISFSDMLARELKDPEFRKLYEAHVDEEMAIRAKIALRIKARKLKEQKAQSTGSPRFAT